MSASHYVGTFVKSGAVTTQHITAPAFRPIALMLFTTYQTTLDTFDDQWTNTLAYSDGASTVCRSTVVNGTSGPSTGSNGGTLQANKLSILKNTAGGSLSAITAEALVSFTATGFDLNWTTNDGLTPSIHYWAMGGADLPNATCFSFLPSGRVGYQSITSIGYKPSVVLFLPGVSSAGFGLYATEASDSIGCATSAQEQWAIANWHKGIGSRPSYATRRQATDRCIIMPSGILSTVSASRFDGTEATMRSSAKFVSRDLNGFTVDWQEPETVGIVYGIAIKGGRWKAGNFQRLQGSRAQSITHLQFQPSALLVATDGRHEDQVGATIPLRDAHVSLGVTGSPDTHSISLHDLDEVGYGSGSSTITTNARIFSTFLTRLIEAVDPAASSTDAGDITFTSFDTGGFTVTSANADANKREICFLAAASYAAGAACTGGGAAPTVTNPAADASLTNAKTPIVFVELALDSGTKRYATQPIADPSTYFGGFKEPRIISIGKITRALTNWAGEFSTASFDVTLDDSDRALRTLEAAGTLMNRRVDIYCVDDVDRRAGTAASRRGSFVIRRWKATTDLQFTLTLEDWFGSQLSEFEHGKLIPQTLFTKATFGSLLADANVNVPIPVCYGALSDEASGTDAQGVVPVYYAGQETLSGTVWDRYVVCLGAVKSITGWFASDLGANDTGNPQRVKMPASTEGVDFLIPGNSGWNAFTGAATTYRTIGGMRLTVIYARGPRSDAARTGGVPITLNLCGTEDVGDGSGTMIDLLPRQVMHALTNHVTQRYQTGAWLSIPSSNGYSQIASVATAVTTAAARIGGGYLGGFILGGNQGQITVAEFLKRAAISGDLQFGVNRHGQLITSMEDSSAAAVASFTDVSDIDAGGISIDVGWDDLANTIPYSWGPYYAPPADPSTTQAEWNTITSVADAGAIVAHLQTKLSPSYDMWLTRDSATADDAAARPLARRTGGGAPYRGPAYADVSAPLQATAADLGDNVSVTHFAGLSGSGWSAQKCRVLGITEDLQTFTVTLHVQKL